MEAERDDVVILGAGPAGLTAAWELRKHDVPTTVLEKDPKYVGGLARTVEHNGYRFDIGGHRFFFKTYTEKVWGISTKELSADWAAQRIKSLDLGVAIRSALMPSRRTSKKGEIVTTLIDKFRYPRLGPGQMWEKAAASLAEARQPVLMGRSLLGVEHSGGRVRSVITRDEAGRVEEHKGSHFISSIPIRELVGLLDPAAPDD